MQLKKFLTLLIGIIASSSLSFYSETLGIVGIFITGCIFGSLVTKEHSEKEGEIKNEKQL